MKKQTSLRPAWLLTVLLTGVAAILARRWQLNTAFEGELSLPIPRATASVVLVCVLVIGGALITMLTARQRVVTLPRSTLRGHRWDMSFSAPGDPVFLALMCLSALCALGAVPLLFTTGRNLWKSYQAALALGMWSGGDNGVLSMATAVLALLGCFGLVQIGRDSYRTGRRGQGGYWAALPAAMGCAWLMGTYRSHAADPVLWDYTPLLLAVIAGMLLYIDWAGMSCTAARPRRTLWMAGVTVVCSLLALASQTQLGEALLLLSQVLSGLAALWRLPVNLEHPPIRGTVISTPDVTISKENQEEETHE